MTGYLNKAIGELASELVAGLLRLRKGYVDAAESLLGILDPAQVYPYEFIVYRLTGFRGRRANPPEAISGRDLRVDLLRMMLDISRSFELWASDYHQGACDVSQLAQRLEVSVKTIQRLRRRGLPARYLVFPDGKRRIGFLDSSVEQFIQRRAARRSSRFSQMTPVERIDIIRRARRMAMFTHCTLSDVARRIAARTGRAVETIRYTIRRHDLRHPRAAIFPHLTAPLDDKQKEVIFRCFLRGVAAPSLATSYHRTRGSIYRVINEMRARQLLQRAIPLMYNPQFELPNADELILSHPAAGPSADAVQAAAAAKAAARQPEDLPPYLKSLYEVPLLSAARERDLFRRYNYIKYKADKLRQAIDINHVRTGMLQEIETLLLQANGVKNEIVRANLRLVVSIAKKHIGGSQDLFELISDGNVALLRAVEKFDYSRGNRFSTYASWAIIRGFARSVPQEQYLMDHFGTGNEDVLDVAAGLRTYDPNDLNLGELRESIDVVLAQLSPRERAILIDHYGLDNERDAQTLEQLGKNLGLSKERVRQIEIAALKKLRKILYPKQADLLS
jgi:RNA polymerase sigma factor (sigma-70 family)